MTTYRIVVVDLYIELILFPANNVGVNLPWFPRGIIIIVNYFGLMNQ
jgi:hypothetical protein